MQDVSTYSLQMLHSSDNESSFQDPNTLEPKILHYGTVIDGLREIAADGRFLQIAGIHLEYDADNKGIMGETSVSEPSRVVNLRVTYDDGSTDTLVRDGEVQGNLSDRSIVMATNDFLLTGGDGYRMLKSASEERGAQRTDIGEQEVLARYISEELNSSVNMPDPPTDPRVIRLNE